MNFKSLLLAFVFFISSPVCAYELYKVTSPYDPCSCEPAVIYVENGQHFIKYRYGRSYVTSKIIIESFDEEAQMLRIHIGFIGFEVAILEHSSKSG